jgi:hypothetical protein
MKWSGAIPPNRIFAPDSEPRGSCFFRRFHHRESSRALSTALPTHCPADAHQDHSTLPQRYSALCPAVAPPCPALERRSSCSQKGARHPPYSRRRGSPRLAPFSVPALLAPMRHAPASTLLIARPARAVKPAPSAHTLLVACLARADEAHVELAPPTLVEQRGCFTGGTA